MKSRYINEKQLEKCAIHAISNFLNEYVNKESDELNSLNNKLSLGKIKIISADEASSILNE